MFCMYISICMIYYINFPFSQNLSFLLHTETQSSSENALLEENSIKFRVLERWQFWGSEEEDQQKLCIIKNVTVLKDNKYPQYYITDCTSKDSG